MSDTAAHLVDRVFPHVPVRQWVLSFPYALRYRLAYDAPLVSDVLAVFTRTVFASLIRRARGSKIAGWRTADIHQAILAAFALKAPDYTLGESREKRFAARYLTCANLREFCRALSSGRY